MKIRIILSTFNRPDFLLLQIKLLKKFFVNDYEIIVLHDSRNNDYVDEFEEICNTLKVQFYHHNSIHGKQASVYHGEALQWFYDEIILKKYVDDTILILDHDMFLIENIDLYQYLDNYDVIGLLQKRGDVDYIWPGIISFKNNIIKNIRFNFFPGVFMGQTLDTGGGTCYILKEPEIKYKSTNCEYPTNYKDINLLDEKINLGYGFEFHMDNKFLHFRNACGWHNGMKKDVNDENKKKILNIILNDFIEL